MTNSATLNQICSVHVFTTGVLSWYDGFSNILRKYGVMDAGIVKVKADLCLELTPINVDKFIEHYAWKQLLRNKQFKLI